MSPSYTHTHGEDSTTPSLSAISSSASFSFTNNVSGSDTVFRSTDAVMFYVSSSVLNRASRDGLKSILGGIAIDDSSCRNRVIAIPERSGVLNIVLHTFYKLSMVKDLSSMEDLSTAVDRLSEYGLDLQDHIQPNLPLFDALLAQTPTHALQVYTLAAQYELHDLAVRVSVHLLSYHLPDMSDETAVRMGGRYSHRLFKLHMSLVRALKRLLLAPPLAHGASPMCGSEKQLELRRAWVLAASYLAWEAKPDTSIDEINQVFLPLGDHLDCNSCKEALITRVQDVIVQWAMEKRSI